ncbi:MAG TPA: hypothetical protein DEO71_22465 [Chryseobacterium sp.]|nr:hypothetical protein [Chryseobacterium sp.]
MSVIKGGEYQNTKAIITNNGGSGSPAKTEVDDRHQINYIRNLHGNITGHTLGKAEYLIDGVWCVGS